jgi:hypothetical protein
MTIGPGRYDDLCTLVRKKSRAQGVLVLILGGNKGPGFSCQADPLLMTVIPELLESVARQIRQDTIRENAGL